MPLSSYEQLHSDHTARYEKLNSQLGWLSFIRLLIFIGIIVTIYFHLVQSHSYWLAGTFLFVAGFLYCIRLYDTIKAKADFAKAMADVNSHEINFYKTGKTSFPDGKEYIDPHHAYSYDLDLFGEGSLYSYLNRTTTVFGRQKLAQSLLHPDTNSIKQRQQAVQELSDNLEFRQHIQALGSIHAAEQRDLDKLKNWMDTPPVFKNATSYYVLLLFPVAALTILGIYLFTEKDSLLNTFYALLILNLAVTFSFAKKMAKQMALSTAVTKVLRQFAEQLKEIEKQSFHSPVLQQLQDRLKHKNLQASHAISQLASLFNYLDFIMNLLVSVLLNGFFLFHVHILYALDRWKKKHATEINDWLDVIGEFESLNCFGNLRFNNKNYCFPELSDTSTALEAREMGHPLIRAEKRVNNDISFANEKFIVLTGSNMSGKSTFLRTLGTNLVLARAGSAVCAQKFTLYPFNLYVSMRITDSLQDSESLFYAELKRLQSIIHHLQSDKGTFVILDEILKGTNSNDKHSGTVGLIRKLAGHRTCGIIATHDLTIAAMSTGYPAYMTNKCFESVIVNDELIFDYKIKEGVCSKLNASFLMRKMGIID